MSEERIAFLQREIATLEWDIPLLKDGNIKSTKQNKLAVCKRELDSLIKNNHEIEAR